MRAPRAIVIAVMLAAAISTGSLASPDCVAACRCAEIASLAESASQPGVVILVGTVQGTDERGVLQITRLYSGSVPANRVGIAGGNTEMCGVALRPGVPTFMVAVMDEGTVLPGSCRPFVDAASPEGQQLIAEAEQLFGAGEAPPPAGADADAATPDGIADAMLLAVMGGLLVVLVAVFGTAALVAGRRRPSG